jgi:hypothetical protein
MKKLFILSGCLSISLFALSLTLASKNLENDYRINYSNDSILDTMIIYNVSCSTPFPIGCGSGRDTFDLTRPYEIKYYVNCVETTQEIFLKYAKAIDELDFCEPCYLITLDSSGNKIMEGMAYQDVYVGKVLYFNSIGRKTKSVEYFNTTRDSLDYFVKYYNLKNGECIYYNEDGTINRIERYKLDSLQN